MRREFSADVAGREVIVTVDNGAGDLRVVIDGRDVTLDCAVVRPGTFSLLIDGRSLVIDVDAEAPACRLQVGTEAVALELLDAQKRRLASAAASGRAAVANGEIIKAPIAGKVIKVLCAEGDSVATGAGVCVLEAMKMENEIRADRGGTVTAIHVTAGDSVETGQKLLTLE